MIFVIEHKSKTIEITLKMGNAIFWHCIVKILHPPISIFGISREAILLKNIPMDNPSLVFGSSRNNSKHIPKAIIIAPIPISALADQRQVGKIAMCISPPPQPQLPPSPQLLFDDIAGAQVLNKNCGPNAISKPKVIIVIPKKSCFFIIPSCKMK